jgi:hypothetical protein
MCDLKTNILSNKNRYRNAILQMKFLQISNDFFVLWAWIPKVKGIDIFFLICTKILPNFLQQLLINL